MVYILGARTPERWVWAGGTPPKIRRGVWSAAAPLPKRRPLKGPWADPGPTLGRPGYVLSSIRVPKETPTPFDDRFFGKNRRSQLLNETRIHPKPGPCGLRGANLGGGFQCGLVGDLWAWLQLMRLQFEVVRDPVGIVWGRFGSRFGDLWAPNWPQINPKRPRPDLGQPRIATA